MKKIVGLLIVLSTVFGAYSALAQESTPEPTPPPTATVVVPATNPDNTEGADLQVAADLLVKLVANTTYLPFAALFVVTITALAKRYIPAKTVSAGTLAMTLQMIVWVAFVLAEHYGYANQFKNVIDAGTTIMGAVAGLAGSSYLATRSYNAASTHDVPLIGNSRSDQ